MTSNGTTTRRDDSTTRRDDLTRRRVGEMRRWRDEMNILSRIWRHNRALQTSRRIHGWRNIRQSRTTNYRTLPRTTYQPEMTKKWLCQTQNPPRIPVFYTLTKIDKPTPVGRPIISGVSGPTERLSAFVEELLQSIAQQQKSYLHSWTLWFIKATDSLPNQCSIFAHTTKLLRHSSTHISPRVTHQE